MIKVIIPSDNEFYLYEKEIRILYEKLQPQIGDTNPFDFVRDNTLFYIFTVDGMLLGGIYYFVINDKLFVNCFAKRGYLKEKLECLKLSTTWFTCDIYAEAQHAASVFCLLRSGFKRLKGNLFIFKR